MLLENKIYEELRKILTDERNRQEIRNGYPDPEVPRRNTGYALDLLLDTAPFVQNGKPFNLSTLLGGSEGTLVFFTAMKLNLVELPPQHNALICAHFDSLVDSLNANIVILKNSPTAVELMDHVVLDCTKTNHTQKENRFFVVGEPKTILIAEFAERTNEELQLKIDKTIQDLIDNKLGYAFPVIYGPDIRKVWELRKAGLGSLANIPGDDRSVTVIEDIAVPVSKQASYILEMEELFAKHKMTCVYHAHVGTGELHLRPLLNLKNPTDIERFKAIAAATVPIVKKYGGSLSGEHGDGRLRAGMIPLLLGEYNYQLINRVKNIFDPDNLFNPGKITQAPPMDAYLRHVPGLPTREIQTYQDFSETLGIMRAAEKCNGSGDCRKSHQAKGGMCPSYQATMDERNTTRARANLLREFLSGPIGKNEFDHTEIYDILDLCLSCKACKSECPSNVDMTKIKAEFLQHWYDAHGISFRTRIIAYLPVIYRFTQPISRLANSVMQSKRLSGIFKHLIGFHQSRSMPHIADQSLSTWTKRNLLTINSSSDKNHGYVYLYNDEFTNHQDASIGIKAIQVLSKLGYQVKIIAGPISARTFISKGILKKAKELARENIRLYHPLLSKEHPLLGIEPSAILGFRDEFPDLVGIDMKAQALEVGNHALLIDEFIEREIHAGRIISEQFTQERRKILLHGHCHQKAVASTASTLFVLNFPKNYDCQEIPSGCCGMAGAFGFEDEHYELSMKVGEMVLFPAVRETEANTLICAPGTSCRHQILDGTGRKAFHPIEILHNALLN
jgi:Fe-S oxidoreductase